MAILEIGVSAAVATGVANWLRVRRDPELAAARALRLAPSRRPVPPPVAEDEGHRLYVDPWAGEAGDEPGDRPPLGPSMLP